MESDADSLYVWARVQASTSTGGETGPLGRQDPGLPQVFGRYLLIQRLSRGGMGEIFIAKHGLAGFEKLAVIKKVLPHLAADAQFISRFVDEAQVAIKLQHVNVAQVFEVGRVGDEYFLALEYVEGRDLRRTIGVLNQQKKRLPVDLALFVGRELANGLAYAHRRTGVDGSSLNLVHCDISPPNVLVSFEGETKVIDFGIAKSAIRGTATDPKMGFGKFGYMAPEQLIRGGVVDYRTDIYAAGVVLFELLTGMRLYEAGPEPDYRALARKVAKGDHKLPSEVDPALAPYDDLVATALRPKVEDRYQSAAEFRDAIQQSLVAVNPTISTDQLGAFMRELFADEMLAQKELHERVALASLSDFEQALQTQAISTVSFAVSAIPVEALGNLKEIPKRASKKMTAPPPVPNATPVSQPAVVPPVAPPATRNRTEDHSLADGTGTVDRMLSEADDTSMSVKKSKKPVAIVAAIGAVAVVGLVIFLVTRGPTKPAAVVAKTDVTATPITDDKSSAAPVPDVKTTPPEVKATVPEVKTDGIVIDPPGKTPTTTKTDATTKKTGERDKHHPSSTKTGTGSGSATQAVKDTPKVAGLSREAVGSKFSAVRREYDAYKQKNGMRLDGQWADLATFVQFNMGENFDEAVRRIDAFRAQLKN